MAEPEGPAEPAEASGICRFLACLRGYRRTVHQYLSTAKGAHDARDYGKAVLLIVISCAAAVILAVFLWQRWHG